MRSLKSRCAQFCKAGSLALVMALAGCGQFFPPLSSGSGGSGSANGDYLYAGNLGTSPLTIAGFAVASTGLTTLSGSPYSVALEPTALAITPDDTYLYMGSAAGAIYVLSLIHI